MSSEQEIINSIVRDLGIGLAGMIAFFLIFHMLFIYVYIWHMQKNRAHNASIFLHNKNNKFADFHRWYGFWKYALLFALLFIISFTFFYVGWLSFYIPYIPLESKRNISFILLNVFLCLFEIIEIVNTIIAFVYYSKIKHQFAKTELTIENFEWIVALFDLRKDNKNNSFLSSTQNLYLDKLFKRAYGLIVNKPKLTGEQLVTFLYLNTRFIDIFTMFLKAKQTEATTKFNFYWTGLSDWWVSYLSFPWKMNFVNGNGEALSTQAVAETVLNYFNAFSLV